MYCHKSQMTTRRRKRIGERRKVEMKRKREKEKKEKERERDQCEILNIVCIYRKLVISHPI